MPLSADQQATLQLVLGRGQTYADLSELLDASEAEIRERARSALEELGGSDPDRNAALTDYLLGQADPIARADAVRHLREDPDDHRLAGTLIAELRELVPGADLPRLPGEPRGGRFLRRDPGQPAAAGGAGADGAKSRGPAGLSPRQSRVVVALGAGAVLVVAGVLALTGAFGSDEEPAPAPPPAADEQPATPEAEDVLLEAPGETVLRGPVSLEQPQGEEGDPDEIQVPLSAVGGGDAGGEASFGLTGSDTVFVDLDLSGLEQASEDETYVLWLLLTREQGWPLAPLQPSRNGSFSERLQIPAGLLPVVAQMRFVTVERTGNDVLAELIEGAVGDFAAPGSEGDAQPDGP